MKSDQQEDGFPYRLRLALGTESVNGFASKCGFAESSVRQYLSGSIPGIDKAAIMAKRLNVTLDWLITGHGPMRPIAPTTMDSPEPQATLTPSAVTERQPLDEDLHASIADGISMVYRDANARLSPADLGRLSARMHGELIDLYDDPADRAVGLKALLRQLQRDLQAPPGKSDKRSA